MVMEMVHIRWWWDPTNRLEFEFRTVLALPKASKIGLLERIRSCISSCLCVIGADVSAIVLQSSPYVEILAKYRNKIFLDSVFPAPDSPLLTNMGMNGFIKNGQKQEKNCFDIHSYLMIMLWSTFCVVMWWKVEFAKEYKCGSCASCLRYRVCTSSPYKPRSSNGFNEMRMSSTKVCSHRYDCVEMSTNWITDLCACSYIDVFAAEPFL